MVTVVRAVTSTVVIVPRVVTSTVATVRTAVSTAARAVPRAVSIATIVPQLPLLRKEATTNAAAQES
jgi:hypothetical protein